MNDEDRECMEVDEAYHTTVTQSAVRRIATLPPELNLAMPHLCVCVFVRLYVRSYMPCHNVLFGLSWNAHGAHRERTSRQSVRVRATVLQDLSLIHI